MQGQCFFFDQTGCFLAGGGARVKLQIIYLTQSRKARKGNDLIHK